MNRMLRFRVILMLALWSLLALPAVAQEEANVRPPETLWEITFSGGWLGNSIMLSIFATSFLAAYLVFEQLQTLRRSRQVPDDLGPEVRKLLAAGRVAEAHAACQPRGGLLAQLLTQGLSEAESGWPAVEKALEDAAAEQSARLFRRVEYLSVIANLAPMLGLLGTVVGMVMCFHEVATSQGTAGAAKLAAGIYTALNTTVAGLVVAIPSLAAFALLRNRVDELVAEAAQAAIQAFTPIKRAAAMRTLPVGSPLPPPPPTREK